MARDATQMDAQQIVAQLLRARTNVQQPEPASCPAGTCYGYAVGSPTPCQRYETDDCPQWAATAAQRHDRWMAACGIGRRYWHPEPGKLVGGDQTLGYTARLAQHVPNGVGLMVTGPCGVGKTMALAHVALTAYDLRPRPTTRMVYSPRLFSELHHDREALNRYAAIGLLLVDDVGSEYAAEWGTAQFGVLVEERHAHRLPTCVTSNATAADLEQRAGWERIVDRWRETCVLVEAHGESQRTAPEVAA